MVESPLHTIPLTLTMGSTWRSESLYMPLTVCLLQMGLPEQPTNTAQSTAAYDAWLSSSCQPNFFANVVGGNSSCPPYSPIPTPSYTPAPSPSAAEAGATPPLRRSPRPANPDISQFNHGANVLGKVVSSESCHGLLPPGM